MVATLTALMKEQGLNQSTLAARANVGKTALSNYMTGRNGVRASNLKKLADALGVNPERLLQPLVASLSSLPRVDETEHEYRLLGRYQEVAQEEIELPFVPYSAYGSFVSGCHDRVYSHEFEKRRVKRLAGKDYANAYLIEIRGNSMAPRYPHGARYVVRPVSDGNWQYATGVHAIALSNEMFVIKRITSNDQGLLTLSSDSTGASMTILLGDINCMWKVGEADYMPEED